MCSGNSESDLSDALHEVVLAARPPTAVVPDHDTDCDRAALRTAADAAHAPYGAPENREELRVRQERAAELTATVTPIARGLYRVVSGSNSEYIVDLDGYVDGEHRAICECNDYRYRCGPDGYDCKHILYVKRLVRNGLLPPHTADPDEWLQTRLDYLRRLIETRRDATDNAVRQRELDRLADRVDQMAAEPYEREYRELLTDATRVFSSEPVTTPRPGGDADDDPAEPPQ